MDLETVKKYLEKGGGDNDDENAPTIHGFPSRFFENFIMQGLRVDLIEKGHLLCSMKVPPRLLNAGNFLHGGATASLVDMIGSGVLYTYGVSSSGVSVEINVTYLDSAYVDEEIEIEARALRVGKTVAVVSVEFRKKETGKIVAQGRHTKYLPVQSKIRTAG
ncbi:Thioesterase domain - like 2 [Theobroma cacao]|nr:Thioesterase domain - like 2 [Theobroma cacao]